MSEPIEARRFHESDVVDDWRVVGEGACAYFRTGSFAKGARLVQAISELANLDAHHPDVDVRHDGVMVRLVTLRPGYYGLSQRDLELAREISAVARQLGVSSDPTCVGNVQVSIDALVSADVWPFWRAVLGYVDRGDDPGELVDPHARGPLVYFQRLREPHPHRNRIHIDVWVPHDQVEARVAAALAAGGRLVTDERAPSWTTLADAEDNRACVCSWQSPREPR